MTPEVQILLTIGGPVCAALITAIGVLWRRVNEIDARADTLLELNGRLQAQVATLQAELDRERQRNLELQHEVTTLKSDLDEAKGQLAQLERQNQRLKDENKIFRTTFAKQGVTVAEPTRRANDDE